MMNTNAKEKQKLIPDEAIRMRILANSNSVYDQRVKLQVKNAVEGNLYQLLNDTKGVEDAKNTIQRNLPKIDNTIKQTLQQENYFLGYHLDFGSHYFPEKTFDGITYEEGNYDSLYITLGKGEGDNWWCVLFPPLCLLEAEESDEVEYQFFIKDMMDRNL